MLLDIKRPQKTQDIVTNTRLSRSTDLTLYEVCELLDDNKQGTGIFRLARKSLETGLPFVSYCDHTHRTADEANACTFFASNGDRKNEVVEIERLFAVSK